MLFCNLMSFLVVFMIAFSLFSVGYVLISLFCFPPDIYPFFQVKKGLGALFYHFLQVLNFISFFCDLISSHFCRFIHHNTLNIILQTLVQVSHIYIVLEIKKPRTNAARVHVKSHNIYTTPKLCYSTEIKRIRGNPYV